MSEEKEAQFLENIGNLLDRKQYTEAVEQLLEAGEECKTHLRYSAYLGLAYYHLEKFEKAVSCFDEVLKHKQTAENVLFMRGLCHDYLDNIPLAKGDYLRVLQLNSTAKLVHRNLGILYESQGDLENAKAYYMRALEIDENDQASQQQLAHIAEGLN